MAIQLIDIDVKGHQAQVILQGDTQEEVMSPTAKHMAIREAQKNGVSRGGVSGTETAYPVDSNGDTSEELILGRAGKAVAFRCKYAISGMP